MKTLLGYFSFVYKLYVGVVFFMTCLIFYPVLYLLLLNKKWKFKTFPVFVVWSWLLCLLILVLPRKIVKNPLPKGPFMIVSNHSSYFDIFIMHSLFPRNPFLFMGKSEILSYPFLRRFFVNLHIPVFRKDIRKAAKAFLWARKSIQDGWSFVVFPEGTIPDYDRPTMIPFKDGAFKLAKVEKMPIVPLTFIDNFHLFSEPLQVDYAHPGISRVIQHPYLSVEQLEKMTEKEISDYCFQLISAPLKKYWNS